MKAPSEGSPLALLLVLAATLLLLTLAARSWLMKVGTPPSPNIILITIDTLRADAVAREPEQDDMPTLSRLAKEGLLMTQATTPLPRTTPALASLLTGLYPQLHGSREVGESIRPDVQTLPEILRDLGYRTLGVSANTSAGPRQGLQRGFDRFVSAGSLKRSYPDRLLLDTKPRPSKPIGWAQATTEQAVRLVRSTAHRRPVFLWAHYFDPHFFYQAPNSPAGDGSCRALMDMLTQHPRSRGRVFSNVDGVAQNALADCKEQYRAELRYTDRWIERLLTRLRRLGRLNNTIVVITADHGENFGEQGLYFEHGDNLHDASMRVPLIFWGVGIPAGQRQQTPASLEDILPTLLTLLGQPPPAGLSGVSLLSTALPSRNIFALSGTSMWNMATEHLTTGRASRRHCLHGPQFSLCLNPRRDPPSFALYDRSVDPQLTRDVAVLHPKELASLRKAWRRWPPESAREYAVRDGRFKLIRRPRLDGGYNDLLLELNSDPDERVDRSADFPDLSEELKQDLDAWMKRYPLSPGQTDIDLDQAIEESLRSLGYIP